ncbi:MAG: hypothetical protein CFE44_01115 [Burkholderiales bacterium PBB4]|nr:MAG: hypothetical protein CFE44_01115 [Burkholderiales bacterium PBB4]
MKSLSSYFQRLFAAPLPADSVAELVRSRRLNAAFQPIINLQTANIRGHEAFVRCSAGHALSQGHELLQAAKQERFQRDFELACVEYAIVGWGRQHRQGQLFINITARSLVQLESEMGPGRLSQLLEEQCVPAPRIVFEITEHSNFDRLPELVVAANRLRSLGASIAMDDVKGSEGSLHVWLQLVPDLVKLDKRLTTGVHQDPVKHRVIQSLVKLAAKCGNTMVAKSVETADDLRALRDLGIDFAQGYFLGSPDASPNDLLNQRARGVISENWAPRKKEYWFNAPYSV